MLTESLIILGHQLLYGGSSFAEASIAFNLIMSSWDQLQVKLRDMQGRIEASSSAAAVTLNDTSDSIQSPVLSLAVMFLHRTGRQLNRIAHVVWRTVWILSIINLVLGVIVLYVGIEHWLLLLLVAHIICYFACSGLLILWTMFTDWVMYTKFIDNIDERIAAQLKSNCKEGDQDGPEQNNTSMSEDAEASKSSDDNSTNDEDKTN